MAMYDTIVADSADSVVMCSANTDCAADKETYIFNAFKDNGFNSKQPIGMAKDGHVIYGPFYTSKKRWCLEPDICNGYTSSDGAYQYITTSYAPFGPSCWGPGSGTTKSQTCSAKPRIEEPDECFSV